jgi:hypothetical protein
VTQRSQARDRSGMLGREHLNSNRECRTRPQRLIQAPDLSRVPCRVQAAFRQAARGQQAISIGDCRQYANRAPWTRSWPANRAERRQDSIPCRASRARATPTQPQICFSLIADSSPSQSISDAVLSLVPLALDTLGIMSTTDLHHPSPSMSLDGGSSLALRTSHGAGRPSFPLLAIVFAEFDNTVGPKITCQAPEGFLSPELFDSISDLIITGPELCHKLVSVNAGPYTVIGYPMQLSHKKYHRNALLFNVAFVFPREDVGPMNVAPAAKQPSSSSATNEPSPSTPPLITGASQLRPYHPVIRKLANQLESLEIGSEFIFRRNTEEGAKALQAVITKIFRSLNAYGECSVAVETGRRQSAATHERHLHASSGSNTAVAGVSHLTALASSSAPAVSPSGVGVPLRSSSSTRLLSSSTPTGAGGDPSYDGLDTARGDAANQIHLKLYPLLTLPPKHIPPYCVPLRTKNLEKLWKTEWDLTLRQVLPFMDGVNYVSRISALSGVHYALVAKCVRQLLYYEAVQLVDIFQFSNLYVPCAGLTLTLLPQSTSSSSSSSSSSELEQARWLKLRRDARRVCRADSSRPKPDWSTMVRLWCGLSTQQTIGEYLKNVAYVLPDIRSPPPSLESLNLHPRKWIQFGLVNGFVKRIHAYPILVATYAAAVGGTAVGGQQQSQGSIISDATSAVIQSLIFGARGNWDDSSSAAGNKSSLASALLLGSSKRLLNNQPMPASSQGIFRPRSRQTTGDDNDPTSLLRASSSDLNSPPPAPPLAPPYAYTGSSSAAGASFRALERFFDGEHHLDCLCTMVQKSQAQLEEEIRRSRRCIMVYK